MDDSTDDTRRPPDGAARPSARRRLREPVALRLAVDVPRWWLVGSLIVLILMAISYLTLDRPVAVQMHTVNETVEDWADQLGRIGRSAWKFIAPAIIAAFCWAIGRRRLARIWLLVPIALIVQGIAVNVLKFLIGRHRPGQLWEADDEYGFRPLSFEYEQHSFPSGHSSDIACLATLATIYMPKLWPLWWAVALLAGAGRVVSESHFISDVIGGLWVGMTITLLVVRYAQQRGWLEPPAQSPGADSAGGR